MEEHPIQSGVSGHFADGQRVVDAAVGGFIGEIRQQMQRRAVLFGVFDGLQEDGVLLEAAVLHSGVVGAIGIQHNVAHLGEAAHELRREVVEHAEHVLVHEHLAVAARAGADADGGDGQLRRHAFGELGGNGLEDHGESAGLFHRVGVFQKLAGRVGRLALHLEAAQRVDALRRKADMGAYGDLAVDDGTDAVRHFHTAFQLHGVGARLLHEAAGVHHRVVEIGRAHV